MNEKDSLNEISDSLKQIADTLKPKPKKPNYGVAIAWIFIGGVMFYMLNELYKMFMRL